MVFVAWREEKDNLVNFKSLLTPTYFFLSLDKRVSEISSIKIKLFFFAIFSIFLILEIPPKLCIVKIALVFFVIFFSIL